MRFMLVAVSLFFVGCTCAITTLGESGTHGDGIGVTSTKEVQPLVPPYQKIGLPLEASGVSSVVDYAMIQQALDLIKSLKGEASDINGEAIHQRAVAYRERQSPMTVVSATLNIQQGDHAQRKISYDCVRHRYQLERGYKTTLPMLTLALYHELMHEVHCHRLMAQWNARTREDIAQRVPVQSRCSQEMFAYAASARFLLVLHQRGILAHVERDAESVQIIKQYVAGWEALAQNRFCPWLHRTFIEQD